MYEILEKKVILRIDEQGERIPLTIADYDRKKGTITVIFMEVGKTTKQLGTMKVGDKLLNQSQARNPQTLVCGMNRLDILD